MKKIGLLIPKTNLTVEYELQMLFSKGYFDIDIDHSNVDVSFNYNITLEVLNENIPDLIITKYAILDSNYDDGDTITYTNINNMFYSKKIKRLLNLRSFTTYSAIKLF